VAAQSAATPYFVFYVLQQFLSKRTSEIFERVEAQPFQKFHWFGFERKAR
jgi:hypothetical protein